MNLSKNLLTGSMVSLSLPQGESISNAIDNWPIL